MLRNTFLRKVCEWQGVSLLLCEDAAWNRTELKLSPDPFYCMLESWKRNVKAAREDASVKKTMNKAEFMLAGLDLEVIGVTLWVTADHKSAC